MRHWSVTGVQTCALPISRWGSRSISRWVRGMAGGFRSARRSKGARATTRSSAGGGQKDRKSAGKGKGVEIGGGRVVKKKKDTKDVGRYDKNNTNDVVEGIAL